MMPPSFQMGQESRFHERWEFRRRDEDFNSSSDDHKSSSSGEPVSKKHKLVSTLISPGNDGTVDIPGFLPQGKNDDPGTGGRSKFGKTKKKKTGPNLESSLINNDTERDSFKKIIKKKSKRSACNSASLGDVKIFMESLLEELKVTRENLFAWMRVEMHKLMETPQPKRTLDMNENEILQAQNQNNIESGMKPTGHDLTQKPTTGEPEIVQVQHQNNHELGLKMMVDETTELPTRRDGSDGQETVQVQEQNNFESGTKLMADDSTEKAMRRQDSYRQETLQLQQQGDFESGTKVMTNDKNWHPTRTEGNCGQQSVQVQHRDNFSSRMELIANDTTWQPTEREGNYGQEIIQLQQENDYRPGFKAQKCNGGSLESSVSTQRLADSKYHFQVFQNQVEHGQDSGRMTTIEKGKGDRLGSYLKPNFTPNSSDQIASSMYLSLPSVIPEPCVESQRIISSSSNYTHPRISGSRTAINTERMLGCFSGMQKEPPGCTSQVGSKNLSCFDQTSAPTSCIGSGFPVPLRQGLDHFLTIPNRVGIENQTQNQTQENSNMMGPKMNGRAITFSGGSHTLSQDYFTNNFYSHLNRKGDGRFLAYQTQNMKGGHQFPS